MKQILIYILTTITLLLAGCTKEPGIDVDMYDYNMVLRFNSSVANADDQENKIETVQLIMVRDGEVQYDRRYTGAEVVHSGTNYSISSPVRLPLGDYDVYVICNLDKIENSENIANFPSGIAIPMQGMIYSSTENIAIPMYGKTTCTVEADTPLSIVFDQQNPLNRLMSKITLNFKADGDFADTKITKVSVNHFSKVVILDPSLHESVEAPSSETVAIEYAMPADAPLILPATYPATFYIPETYLNSDPGNTIKPYIEVHAIINNAKTGGLDLKTKYKLEIATGTPTTQDKSYVRNTQYNITATVKGYGQANDMFVKVNVLPWNVGSSTGSEGGYVTFLKATFNDGTKETSLSDKGNVTDMGGAVKIYCNTNVGGWYVIVHEGDKIIMNTKDSPTEVVKVDTEQSIEIMISKLDYFDHNYKVSIHHPIYISELVLPIDILSFTQYGGFIPNSVLIAAGWPTDKLPKTGLQIAKRGNQRLPSGVAETDDPSNLQWKTKNTTTLGVELVSDFTKSKLGVGKSSTDAMVATPALAAEHPAANYCRQMGPEWYMPSVAESRLIFNNKASLGPSYSFAGDIYWSATEVNADYSWYVNFNTIYTTFYNKIMGCRVRCVREI